MAKLKTQFSQYRKKPGNASPAVLEARIKYTNKRPISSKAPAVQQPNASESLPAEHFRFANDVFDEVTIESAMNNNSIDKIQSSDNLFPNTIADSDEIIDVGTSTELNKRLTSIQATSQATDQVDSTANTHTTGRANSQAGIQGALNVISINNGRTTQVVKNVPNIINLRQLNPTQGQIASGKACASNTNSNSLQFLLNARM